MFGSGIGDPRGSLWARNWKFQKNAKLQISGIGNCKFANSDIGKSQNCEHAKLKIRKLEIANLQIRKFGNLQNCEYAKLKIQKLQIANLKIQKLETAHMGDLEVWAFGTPGGEGFAPPSPAQSRGPRCNGGSTFSTLIDLSIEGGANLEK